MGDYYDGTKLLSMLDINGNKPELYICTANRTGGKTTYFGRMVINRFKKKGSKFCLIYRFNYELADCADKFFKDLHNLFFKEDEMSYKSMSKNVFCSLYLNGEHRGYAICLNTADQIKKLSHLFSDVECMIFDEFQSETNHYCPNEINKFISVHTSIARGNGEMVRYVPVYMISNPVTILNPYYIELGISSRLNSETKFLRGDGFVMEQGFVEAASKAQKTSAFNRAFGNNSYIGYSAENIYLFDNKTFIENVSGRSRYICTLKYENVEYAVREFPDKGIVYCDDRADKDFKLKIAVTTEDHQINYVMLRNNDIILSSLKYYFEHGCFRFKNLKSKDALLKALSYK